MANILFISSSPSGAASNSLKIGNEVVETLKHKHPGATVVHRDLEAHPLPYINSTWVGAVFTPAESRSSEQKALLADSDKATQELLSADVIVIASGMNNFGIPATLKSWVDHILRAGLTFKYTETGPVGLVPPGKKLYLIDARGGIYAGAPVNHQAPYLKDILGFIGITDVHEIVAEGLAYGPEAAEKSIAAAMAAAKAV